MEFKEVSECPYYLITRVSLVATTFLKRELARAGVAHVRPAYLGVLMSLWVENNLKAVELGKRAGLEPSSMTGLLDRMERDALVVRKADPADRRAQRIRLTESGLKVKDSVLEVLNRALKSMLEGVGERDVDRLKESLRRILANTHKQSEQ
ncbi:MAG TPA: MarR family transcriptional regulator [Myxococcota bacterium]|nr:MarR family transcriptional regulator [Myxococcota bacterium]